MLFNKTRNQGLLDSRNYKAFYKQNIFLQYFEERTQYVAEGTGTER